MKEIVLSIHLREDVLAKLEKISKDFKIPKARIVKVAIKDFLHKFEIEKRINFEQPLIQETEQEILVLKAQKDTPKLKLL